MNKTEARASETRKREGVKGRDEGREEVGGGGIGEKGLSSERARIESVYRR